MIHILDQKTIDRIAAGEVIERPASVVKELVENAIDAGATRITVEIKDGGIAMIRVTDNGSGIPAEDVRRAFLPHATSKLRDAAELVGIGTLGFRGEALSTISAVTETEMITKTPEALTGTTYVIRGGTEVTCEEIGAPDGTTILSRNIFYNTPARLKFLKTPMTEGSYISDLMSHIALSHPEVSVRLINNGKTMLDTAGSGSLKDTVYTLYGRDITGGLLSVDHTEGEMHLTGFIGKPFLSRGNRSFENYFVNHRYIKAQVVNRAIEEAYKTYIMQHRFPFTVLFLELPKELCDVNVHPTKREFKYQDEKGLFSLVFHGIQETLKQSSHIPDMNTDYGNREKIYRGNPDLQPPRAVTFPERAVPENPPEISVTGQGTNASISGQGTNASISGQGTNASVTGQGSTAPAEGQGISLSEEVKRPFLQQAADHDGHSAKSGFVSEPAPKGSSYRILEALMPKDFREKLKNKDEQKQKQALENRLAEEKREEARRMTFRQELLTDEQYLQEASEITVIGLAFDTYWITQYQDTLYLMDQHAAHEKVNYERFLAEFRSRDIHSQQLFPPRQVTLSGHDKEAVLNHIPLLEKMGFSVSDFGGNEVRITAVPANLLGLSDDEVFHELVAYISAGVEGVTEDIFVRKLATMGCKAAVKGNQEISLQEVKVLMQELLKLENPYTCPHGRPTIIRMTKDELDRKFKRIVE